MKINHVEEGNPQRKAHCVNIHQDELAPSVSVRLLVKRNIRNGWAGLEPHVKTWTLP